MQLLRVARRFILKTKGDDMAKIKITMGYRSFILPAAKAVTLLELLDSVEMYEDKYHSGEEGKPGFYTQHVYDLDADEKLINNVEFVNESSYKMYKLAGKPQN